MGHSPKPSRHEEGMAMEELEALEKMDCGRVFYYFKEICKIPHGSGHEMALSDYIVRFAQERGLYCRQDARYNVVVKKPGSEGFEAAPPLIVQGHIDMVCEKNADVAHDFLTEPLELYIDGDFLRARGTTLGADNGIAVAYMLAMLEDGSLAHPPLEAVFTVEEEIGMGGASDFDTFDLEGKRFLNMDTEEEGNLLVSCCGGRRMRVYLPVEREARPAGEAAFVIRIRGLKGGHSGADIHLQRASANRLLGRTLYALREGAACHLVQADGGNMDNAICREAEAVVSIRPEQEGALRETLAGLEKMFREEYISRESSIMITMEPLREEIPLMLADGTRDRLIALLMLLPYGVQTMSREMEGLVESSSNIGILKTNEDDIFIDNAVRSSVESRKELVCQKIQEIARLCGARTEGVHDYPGWQYRRESELLEIFRQAYVDLRGKEPNVVAIHAGVECGLFSRKIEGLDMISIGPDMFDVHTPDERLSISSTARVWEYLKEVLKRLG